MTKKQQQIIKSLNVVNVRLQAIHKKLQAENKNGKQFDFVNAPKLSEAADCLNRWNGIIDRIVYQK